MVLQQLGSRINAAFRDYVDRANRFDERALDACLKEICAALLSSDVNVKLVAKLRDSVRAKMLPILQASQNVSGQGVTSRERQQLQKVRSRQANSSLYMLKSLNYRLSLMSSLRLWILEKMRCRHSSR